MALEAVGSSPITHPIKYCGIEYIPQYFFIQFVFTGIDIGALLAGFAGGKAANAGKE